MDCQNIVITILIIIIIICSLVSIFYNTIKQKIIDYVVEKAWENRREIAKDYISRHPNNIPGLDKIIDLIT